MELTYHQQYYQANREKFLERARQQRQRDPAAIAAYQAEYFQTVTKPARRAARVPRPPKKIKAAKTVRMYKSKVLVPINPRPEPLPPPAPCFRWEGVTIVW
jgi:hypothetical protein